MKIKKLLSAILVSAMACTALASCTALTEKSAANGALTYIGLRINPEIEMVTDETGVVVSANAVNNDGEVVLSEVELEGKTAEEAVVEFTETAVDLGYMDVEAGKDTVYVDVNSENAEITEKVEKSLCCNCTCNASENGPKSRKSENDHTCNSCGDHCNNNVKHDIAGGRALLMDMRGGGDMKLTHYLLPPSFSFCAAAYFLRNAFASQLI